MVLEPVGESAADIKVQQSEDVLLSLNELVTSEGVHRIGHQLGGGGLAGLQNFGGKVEAGRLVETRHGISRGSYNFFEKA